MGRRGRPGKSFSDSDIRCAKAELELQRPYHDDLIMLALGVSGSCHRTRCPRPPRSPLGPARRSRHTMPTCESAALISGPHQKWAHESSRTQPSQGLRIMMDGDCGGSCPLTGLGGGYRHALGEQEEGACGVQGCPPRGEPPGGLQEGELRRLMTCCPAGEAPHLGCVCLVFQEA